VDGRAVLLPTGGDLLQSESWYSEAHRTALSTGDCEDSGTMIVTIASRCTEVARDKALREKFPVLRGIGNALRHHVVGLTVMAANAGDASSAGEDHAAIAGHAACFAISKPSFVNAVKKGFACSLLQRGKDQASINKASNHLAASVLDALYTDDRADLPQITNSRLDEQRATMATEEDVSEKVLSLQQAAANAKPLFDHVASGPLVALGIEGTAPVSPTLLYSKNESDRKSRQMHSRNDVRVNEIVKQGVARGISTIDVDPNDMEKNKFYKSIVEIILATSHPMCTSPALRDLGVASPHFVFQSTKCTGSAGCTPKEIAMDDFELVPLYGLNSETGLVFDSARADVLSNTMPRRAGKETLTKEQVDIVNANIELLKSVGDYTIAESDRKHTNRFLITLASLTTEGGLAAFVQSLKEKRGRVGISVDSHKLDGVLHDENGASVGEFVCVNIEARVR